MSDQHVKIKPADLRRVVELCHPCINSSDAGTFAGTFGCLLEIRNNQLTLVGTDCRQLMHCEIECDNQMEEVDYRWVVDLTSLYRMRSKLNSKVKNDVCLKLGRDFLSFSWEHGKGAQSCICQQIEGRFPSNWMQHIPATDSSCTFRARIKWKEWLKEWSTQFQEPCGHSLHLSTDEPLISTPLAGPNLQFPLYEAQGSPVRLKLNLKQYIIPFLKRLKSNALLYVYGPHKPILIKPLDASHFNYILQPMVQK